jgi:amidase/aspartyl-tRNA(Asn)/glutamyl-tRNA(Gln) amidotransferase subunit A
MVVRDRWGIRREKVQMPTLAPSLAELGLGGLLAGYSSGTLTPVEVLEDTYHRLDAINPAINAIAFINGRQAFAAAEESAERWKAGKPLSALDGVPVSIKDSIGMAGTPWRHGTAPNASLPLATADTPPAARLREAGAVVFAKTTMPDFGMLGAGVSSLYGVVRNPWDLGANTGGSSAGAGASLASGLGWAGIGTDIAGSVRIPAAHCGLAALKPTQGRIPHTPHDTARTPGPMARGMAEVKALYQVLAQADPRDLFSLPAQHYADSELVPAGLRIGVLDEIGSGPVAAGVILDAVHRAARLFGEAGAIVEPIAVPFQTDPYPALDRLFQARALAELQGFSIEEQAQVQPDVAAWARGAEGRSAVDYQRDLVAVGQAAMRFSDTLGAFDLVLSPAMPVTHYPAEEVGLSREMPFLGLNYTLWHNQTGAPAATICFGMDGRYPIAVQLSGRRFGDPLVLSAATWLEARRGFDPDWPFTPRSPEETR